MADAWHNHPYIIMGVGGIIVLYFLWPSKSAAPSSSASSDYANQLAAETQLSQTQLATQAAVNENEQNNNATLEAASMAAVAQGNSAIAAANAAAIVSYNQTAQTEITGATNLATAQVTAQSTDFQALIKGLTEFGATSTAGLEAGGSQGLSAYLSGIGADFSSTNNGADVSVSNPGNTPLAGGSHPYNNYFNSGGGGSSGGGGYGNSYEQWSGGFNNASYSGPSFSELVNASSSPFVANDSLLASLWGQMIVQSGATKEALTAALPVTAVQPPALTGTIQSIPIPAHV